MLVLMNHIYELQKGVRHMVLFTCNKKHSEMAIQRLESQGIPYLLQPAGRQNLNVYFGRRECLERNNRNLWFLDRNMRGHRREDRLETGLRGPERTGPDCRRRQRQPKPDSRHLYMGRWRTAG